MIPIRDVIPSRTTPWIALAFLAVMGIVFGWTLTRPDDARIELQLVYGLTPGAVTWPALFFSGFIHTSLLAFAANALVIGVFGEAVEDRLGHARTLLLLLGSSLAAAAVLGVVRDSPYPIVGAAAAAGATIGARLALFRASRVLVLLPLADDAVELPDLLLVATWLVMIAGALGPLDMAAAGHSIVVQGLAGAVFGAGAAFVLQRRERARPDWWSPLGRGLLP
jgi:membrane associated rhomboid family serine protease